MPDELKNLDEGQVLPSEEATGEDELTLEQVSKMKPEEVVGLAKNAKKAIAAATQRNMETAQKEKQWQAEREYLIADRQRKDDEIKTHYDRLAQISTVQQSGYQPPPSPRLEEMSPEDAYKRLYESQLKLEKELKETKGQWSQDRQKLETELHATQRAIEYRMLLEKEIQPNYPDVNDRDLEDWFTTHPTIPWDKKTTHLAAKEIQDAFNEKIEAKVQERLKGKAIKAEKANVPVEGASLVSLPNGRKMIDLSEEEQMAVLKRDFEQIEKQ